MIKTILTVFLSPFVWGLCFLGLVIADVLGRVFPHIDNTVTLGIGLSIGAALGLMATLRGSWIWIKP